jgi:DNA-binding beta-propeller fold protein YncE
MFLLVTSATGANGDGYGKPLVFDASGSSLGVFSDDSRVFDPRGVAIERDNGLLFLNSGADRVLALDQDGKVVRDTGQISGLNPGGGNFGPDGRYYVGLRSARSIMAFSTGLETIGEYVLPNGIVPFPRGFAFGADGRLFLASGVGPNGEGDNTIVAFALGGSVTSSRLVTDPELSPLDLAIAPNGNIVVSSEHPFGSSDALTTVREYDAQKGHLIRVFSPNGLAEFQKPRGLRFGPDGQLYCVARDEVVAFDFVTGKCLGVTVRLPRLNGQALLFLPWRSLRSLP